MISRSRVLIVLATTAVALLALAATAGTSLGGGLGPFKAHLVGANEVPGPGDPDGSGTFAMKIKVDGREICYSLHVFDIAPATAAHIHAGHAGVAGGVVVTLGTPTGGSSSGCIGGLGKDLLKDIQKNPGRYYVNVHNAAYPSGAIRGQIVKT